MKATVTGTISAINGKNVIIKDETGTFQIYNPTNLAELGLGDKITITGTIGEHNSTKQINASATATIDEDHSEVGCKYPETGLTAVCTLCGAITEHTCVDTTPADGKCDLCEATVVAPGSTLASVEILTYASENNLKTDGSVKYSEIIIDENVKLTIGGGSNSGKIFSDGLRLYATDTPAGSITITAAEGKTIKSVKITTVTGIYAFLQVTGNTAEDLSNTEVEVNASSITFNTVKNGDKGKQSIITKIEVVYE